MRWTSIHKKKPKKGQKVLVYVKDEGIIQAEYNPDEYNYRGEYESCSYKAIFLGEHGCGCCGGPPAEVTHWMPLPLEPKEN